MVLVALGSAFGVRLKMKFQVAKFVGVSAVSCRSVVQ